MFLNHYLQKFIYNVFDVFLKFLKVTTIDFWAWHKSLLETLSINHSTIQISKLRNSDDISLQTENLDFGKYKWDHDVQNTKNTGPFQIWIIW